MNHVFVECLKTEQLAAFILQLQAGLAKFCRQSAGQMGNRHVRQKVDKDDGQQGLGITARSELVGWKLVKIVQLQQRSEKNKRDGGCKVCPIPRQQHAGNNNDERIEAVVKGVNSARNVNHGGNKRKVDDEEFNRQQERNDNDADLDQPCQPGPLIELCVAHLRLFS